MTYLTPRESQVAHLLAQGMTAKEIASTLQTSPKTVEAQIATARLRAGATSRLHLAVLATQGLLATDRRKPA